ncbi:Uncharacterised protein [Legionella busanensis]|uniref:N-acetyltransferase domain-containing protein n=1 Tax=Legionella busanensis TaxID=190655 RepID=A0A378JMQ7_9GAMM|nr:hypothetical protein [Legionella busanensis]STX51593.1 Uncharacterised protein [Legionella busanensis]
MKKYELRFWSETESDSAQQVKKLPKVINSSSSVLEELRPMSESNDIAKNIYTFIFSALKGSNQTIIPLTNFQYAKVIELSVIPKNKDNQLIHLSMYKVCYSESNQRKMNYFFLIDENLEVAGYAHFSYIKEAQYVQLAYPNLNFIAIDTIESKKRESYSLGTVLVQAVFEQSLVEGAEGRLCLFSVNKSGGFYFKLGFTAVDESIFDKLYFEGAKDVDGGIMFLTSDAMTA